MHLYMPIVSEQIISIKRSPSTMDTATYSQTCINSSIINQHKNKSFCRINILSAQLFKWIHCLIYEFITNQSLLMNSLSQQIDVNKLSSNNGLECNNYNFSFPSNKKLKLWTYKHKEQENVVSHQINMIQKVYMYSQNRLRIVRKIK